MVMFKRKQVIVTIIICMVLVAGYINWAYQTNMDNSFSNTDIAQDKLGEAKMVNAGEAATPAVATSQPETNATVKQAKELKTTSRSRAMETLKETINNPSASKENKDKASAELTSMASAMEKEGICEGAILSKNIGDAVVFISNGNVTVGVKNLKNDDVSKIKDIVITNTGLSADKIKISSIK